MASQHETRIQLEQVAQEFYAQALNLTLRNPLLRLPTSARGSRFISLPSQSAEIIAETLESGARGITFVGHDAPPGVLTMATASQRSGARGLLRIVLPMKHDLVEAALRSISRKHAELVEKRGLPCAFVTFGALKWTADDGKVTRSPLLLVPVEIDDERDSQLLRTVHAVTASEREPVENPALRKYLQSKFDVLLPRVQVEFECSWQNIRQWLAAEVSRITQSRPDWVVEDSVGFGLFDCGAIAADCDLSNWVQSPAESDLLRRVFCATHVEPERDSEHQFMLPSLVLAADGSQVSALQTIARGASVVMHGPPGSGKSQTIVNVIAQALAADRSVLFVAQKPEAAHVVHRRLAECGMDPFCSMLVPTGESRNTKSAVLENLRKRDALSGPRGAIPPADSARLEQNIDLLNQHAGALGINLPELQLTARQAVAELAVLSMEGIHAVEADMIVLPESHAALVRAEQALERLDRARGELAPEVFRTLGGIRSAHPSTTGAQAGFTFQAVTDRLAAACEFAEQALKELAEHGWPGVGHSVAEVEAFVQRVPPILQLEDPGFVARVLRLHAPGAVHALKQLIEAQDAILRLTSTIPRAMEVIKAGDIVPTAEWQSATAAVEVFKAESLSRAAGVALVESVDAIRQLLELAWASVGEGPVFALLARPVPVERWLATAACMDRVAAPEASRAFLVQQLAGAPQSYGTVRDAAEAIQLLDRMKSGLRKACLLEALPGSSELRVAHGAIDARRTLLQRVVGSVTDGRYRSAKRLAKRALLPNVPRREWARTLERCVEWADASEAWVSTAAKAGLREGHSTDSMAWGVAQKWLADVAPLAEAAQVPIAQLLAVMHAIEAGEFRSGEHELLRAACAVSRRGDVCDGLRSALGGRQCDVKGLTELLESLVAAGRTINRLGDAIGVKKDETLGRLGRAGMRIYEVRDACHALQESPAARALFAEDFRGADTPTGEYEVAMAWLELWQDARLQRWARVREWLFGDKVAAAVRCRGFGRCAGEFQTHVPRVVQCVQELAGGFVFNGSAKMLAPALSSSFETLAGFAQVVRSNQSSLQAIFAYGLQAEACAQLAGAPLLDRYSSGEIGAGALTRTYRRTVLEDILRRDARLAPLVLADRAALEDSILALPRLDAEIRKVNAQRLVREVSQRQAPWGVATGRVREYTELGLVRHLLGGIRPRFEVQDLFRRARAAMRKLQPCVIATPDAVSEFLPRESGSFDLLIMDEASQVPPSAAFGSLARAKQAVIVGDPRQLPPSSFFMGGGLLDDESDDEDQSGVTNVESILERAISSLKNVHLNGHYRSRHHSLIAFSNRRFYDRRLVVAPNVQPRDAKYGVSAQFVQNGRYSAGENAIEAEAVAHAAMLHLLSGSGESLGIVAFNAKQADLIESHLEALANQSHAKFDAYSRASKAKHPLFVRNLESVQGDERDVIFISYTYGPDAETGQVYQRFGPVLRQGGERRLNVLVTRAQNRVVVFHSMRPHDINSQSEGGKVMREYLEYALQAPEADFVDGEFESDFEEQVARAIEGMSNELVVRPQVQCDGFRIDLGVECRARPGRFVLGVECDGATYHNSANARDRDLVRQTILEQRGWMIHRIWSTAWWKNPALERERLAATVKGALEKDAVRRNGSG